MRGATITFKRVTRHKWGAEPNRVVLVTITREPDGATLGQVWGAKGGTVEELERQEGATLLRQSPPTVSFDGGEWTVISPGCSCNVPSALRAFNPLR